MNKKLLLILLCTVFASSYSKAQTVSSAADSLILKVAQKMKDSLSLTSVQHTEIIAITRQLTAKKTALWPQYPDRNQLTQEVQKVENTRDSLYQQVLTGAQYMIYQEKKLSIISN